MEYVKPEKYYKEYEDDELDKFKSEIKENRINEIEEFLTRRRRGSIFNSR